MPDKLVRSDPARRPAVWRRFLNHPLSPVLLFLLVSQFMGESYPFSRFAMYSNPSPEPLSFEFLADAEGKPIGTRQVLGLSSTSLMKIMSGVQGDMEDEENEAAERERRSPRSERELRVIAAGRVLDYVTAHAAGRSSKKRSKQPLPASLRLMENTVSVEEGRLVERQTMLAEKRP